MPATLGTAEVVVLAPAVHALDAMGVASGPVLSAAGIAAASLARVDDRVPYDRVLAAWEHAASAAKDPAFGVHVAATIPPGALDLMDYLFSTSPTLLDAYRRIAKYPRIFIDSVWYRVAVSGVLVKISRHGGDAGHDARQFREFAVATFVRRGRDATGVHWIPRRVAFGHAPHEARDEVERFFGTTVEYGHGPDHMWFDRDTAALPLRASDSRLSAILLRYADSLLPASSGAGFVGMAHNAIVHELSTGSVSVAKGAARLGMSARTLQRRLRSHHVSHRQLLDESRFDLASAYLCDPSTSITQISIMLEFADVSAFTRAFKRWSGMTPSEFRRRHGSRAPGTSEALAARCGHDRTKSRDQLESRRG
jgi:AraC-like DNA-binding protein